MAPAGERVGWWAEGTAEAERQFVAHTEGQSMAHMLFSRNANLFRKTKKYLERKHFKGTEQSGRLETLHKQVGRTNSGLLMSL